MSGKSAYVHGCAAIVGATGVFIRGPSASGKSRLTDALVNEAENRGVFSRWVADDRVLLKPINGRLIASAPETISGHIEHHHFGVRRVMFIQSAVIDLVVDLVPAERLERMPDESATIVVNIELPLLVAPKKQLSISVPLVFAALRKSAEQDTQTGQ